MHGSIPKTEVSEDIFVEFSETCLKCANCAFIGNESQMKKHRDTIHANLIKCQECGNNFSDVNTLNCHIKMKHYIEPFPCELCGLVLANFTLLQKHITSVHSQTHESCPYCNFQALNKEDMQTHYIEAHEEYVILHTMAKQVNDMSEEFPTFQTIQKQFSSFETFMTDILSVLNSLFQGQNAIKQELFVLRNEHHNKTFQKASNETNSQTKYFSSSRHSTPPTVSEPRHQPPPSMRRSSSPLPVGPKDASKPKTLYVGDSISGNVDIDTLEKATRTKFITAKAYSSTHGTVSNVAKHAPRFPQANFSSVVHEKLQTEEFDNLIIQAGSVDITNLKTNVEPAKNAEYFKQEAVMSAKNLFSVCESAVEGNPNLKKVVLMKQTPRYDPVTVDPCSMKPVLSELFNSTLVECWMSSKVKDKIFIGSHNIDCTGGIREARYRETKTGRFDGIHLLGSSGKKAFTNSVLNIINLAEMMDPGFDHQHCPQTRHQGRKKSTNWENDVDIRRSENVRAFYAHENQRYEIPTYNRFAGFADNYQGNY